MADDQICPKCRGAMRSYERNRVVIEQCTECRGIFLDRGELEQLLDAEAEFNRAELRQPAPTGRPPYDHRDQRHGYDDRRGGHPRRRKSFLSELFD